MNEPGHRRGHSKCHWARCQTKICYCIRAQKYALIFELAASAIFVMGGTDGIVHNNEGQVLRRQALCCDNEVSYQRSDIAAYVMTKSLETQTPRHYVST